MSMRHGSSNPQPHPAILPHLRWLETPNTAQSGGGPQEALGTGWDTAADCGLRLTHRTENLAWPGTQKKKRKKTVSSSQSKDCDLSCSVRVPVSRSLVWMASVPGKQGSSPDLPLPEAGTFYLSAIEEVFEADWHLVRSVPRFTWLCASGTHTSSGTVV